MTLLEASKKSLDIENKNFKSENNRSAKAKYFGNKQLLQLIKEKDPKKKKKLLSRISKNHSKRIVHLIKSLYSSNRVNPINKVYKGLSNILNKDRL